MQYNHLQLMLHGNDIADSHVTIDNKGVSIDSVVTGSSDNYLFLYLNLNEDLEAQTIQINLTKNGASSNLSYEFKSKEWTADDIIGFNPSDAIYLITPDRFANGDPSNDEIEGLKEGLNRSADYGRHGGDIQGIIDHLPYLDDMGFTAIWLNPVLINDMPEWSYHGYATTDYYKVDPRFGSNESYRALTDEARARGMKLIMDIIVNHCGLHHWWMEDLPFDDWLNFQDLPYQETNHQKSSLVDPYRADIDRKIMTDGWFVRSMPDLNQRNPHMAEYLIQNSIWWIEYLGLAGIRQDTYSYPDRDFMTDWTCRIMEEYPNFSIVGEEWTENPAVVSYWQRDKLNHDGYTSCLTSLMDFPLQMSLSKGLNEDEGWATGLRRMYEMVSNDFLYAHPEDLVIFPDNHDMSRIFTQVDEDIELLKIALAYTLTMRGTPQIYYGTEVLMSNPGTTSHGVIRSDFYGGWEGDEKNARTGEGLSEDALTVQEWLKKLLNWRKGSKVIHEGGLKHYIPYDGVYVYFRSLDEETVMIVINKSDKEIDLKLDRFKESIKNKTSAKNILDNTQIELNDSIKVSGKSINILELE